jgi:Peptidase family S41
VKLRMMGPVVSLALIVTSCTTQGTLTPSNAPASGSPALTRLERWAADIDYLATQMRTIHPDLYHGVSKPAFDAAVSDLADKLPTLSDDEILVGVMHLVALISSHGRDGHMGVWPPDNPEAVHRFPIRVWEFPDGLFVTAARQPDQDLVGSRILSIDGLPVEDVFRRLDPVVPRDNASNLRAARTVFLTSAEVLAGLGIAEDPLAMTLEVQTPGGARRTMSVDAVDAGVYADWVNGWELVLPKRPGLLFLRDTSAASWLEYLAPSRTLYVQYNVVDEDSKQLVGRIRSAVRHRGVDRLVLDLRNNGGGEAGGYRDLLRFLVRADLDRAGRLYVLIGRLTFSAGASLAVLLQEGVPHASFVGEASGGAPDFWADPATVTLPNSHLVALIPDRYFGIGGPRDRRLTVEPDIPVAFTSSDYFSGHDPVLERALSGVDG